MAGHGGRRVSAGRPKNDPPCHRCSLYLTDEQIKLLRMWGRGDMSAGLRWLVDTAKLLIWRSTRSDDRTTPPQQPPAPST